MFEELIGKTPDSQHMTAAEFFISLKKEAGLRAAARQQVRNMADTNTLPTPAPAPAAVPAKPVKQVAKVAGVLEPVKNYFRNVSGAAVRDAKAALSEPAKKGVSKATTRLEKGLKHVALRNAEAAQTQARNATGLVGGGAVGGAGLATLLNRKKSEEAPNG